MADTVRVDLHCHSSASDGDHPPEYIARQLSAIGVVGAALTDHNTVAGQGEFRDALAKHGIHFVSGVEINARAPGGPLHLVAYGLDIEDPLLLHVLQVIRQPGLASVRHLVDQGRVLGRRLSSRGLEETKPPRQSRSHRPPDTAQVISMVHAAGGRVFLAHPLAVPGSMERLDQLLDWLQPQGLDGLEVFYKPYPQSVQQNLLDLADRRRLLASAGSDFHGWHHTDGASLGVQMPMVHWSRFLAALGLGQGLSHLSPLYDVFAFRRGTVGN